MKLSFIYNIYNIEINFLQELLKYEVIYIYILICYVDINICLF